MHTPKSKASRKICFRLLEAYERSKSYGRRGPWPRAVIVPLDEAGFPEAFKVDGREARVALTAAARELSDAGAATVIYHKHDRHGLPREVRLGPMQVEAAYQVARADGFVPLHEALSRLSAHSRALAAESGIEWFSAELERVANAADRGELLIPKVKSERFKRDEKDILDSLTAATARVAGVQGMERVVSERIFGDSKRLAAVRGHTERCLLAWDPRWRGVGEEAMRSSLLSEYGVMYKPLYLSISGCAALRVNARTYQLEDFVPAAQLPEDWSNALSEGLSDADLQTITTIENETSFFQYIEAEGGPQRLGARGEVVIYTGGFPAMVLTDVLRAVGEAQRDMTFRHWGDADAGGLEIWWVLRTRIGRPISLFRTTADWVRQQSSRRGRPLTPQDRKTLSRLEQRISAASGPDVEAALELRAAIMSGNTKFEQERWSDP